MFVLVCISGVNSNGSINKPIMSSVVSYLYRLNFYILKNYINVVIFIKVKHNDVSFINENIKLKGKTN